MTEEVQQPTPDTPAPAGPATDELQARLAALQADLEAARKEAAEATLRAQAELQNVRKRLERDADNVRKFVLERFAGELLAVVDSLERGLAAMPADNESLKPAREGTDLTLKLFKDTLRKFEVEEIDPRGQPFNPQFHEAVAQIPSPMPPNMVVEVMQKGFQLSGRLLRPAMVVVSRAPATTGSPTSGTTGN